MMNGWRESALPLSSAQLGVWLSHKIGPAGARLNIAELLEIHGALDPRRIEAALETLIEETEALHARFVEDADRVSQLIAPRRDWKLSSVDCARTTKSST